MTAPPPPSLWRDRQGAAALETALLAPVLLALLLGVMEVGRMAWTRATLTYAVQETARYASVRKITDDTQLTAFAAARAAPVKARAADFSVIQNPACGRQVSASVTRGFILYKLAPTAPAISVRACRA